MTVGPSREPAPPAHNGTVEPADDLDDKARSSGGVTRATVSHSSLAEWLLEKEMDAAPDTPGLSAAAERVCQKLTVRLTTLVSATGSQAMLSRAIHLSRAQFPFLEGVRAGVAPGVCLVDLGEHLRTIEPGKARQALLAVLGALLGLLIQFIGEGLTLRLVREVWSDLPQLDSGQPAMSDRQEADW